MFEQAVLPGGPKGKRVWTTCAGVGGQVVLVAAMVVAPMLFPQVMPQGTFAMLVPHAPAGAPRKGRPDAKPHALAKTHQLFQVRNGVLFQPHSAPAVPVVLIEDPVAANETIGVAWGIGEIGSSSGSGLVHDILTSGQNVPRTEAAPRVVEQPKPAAAPIVRVKEGGNVRPPRLIYRIEPRYPPLAVTARIQGVVQLSGVIATDGHLIELTIESGHPLLVREALNAVSQWRYEPTLLNGVPVEVVTKITVSFVLSH